MLIVFAIKQGDDECKQQPSWKSLLEIRSQALSRHLADAGAHHLHRGHQRPRKECGPEKFGSELRAGNGVCGDARRVVVSSPGNDSGPERLQQRSNPTRWGGCAHGGLGCQSALKSNQMPAGKRVTTPYCLRPAPPNGPLPIVRVPFCVLALLVCFIHRVFGFAPSILNLTPYLLGNALDLERSITCQTYPPVASGFPLLRPWCLSIDLHS